MTPSIEIKLSGTLGERHRRLNASVRAAYQHNKSFQSVQNCSEISPTDKLFKIDLASKQRNVDYIIHSLKDDDMLYVSRALKSVWLLETEYSEIINPIFLEDQLFAQMTMQAANKMRHWIQLHLRDPKRCEDFYTFYKGRNFDTAVKFLWHCSSEFILNEFINILDKVTAKHLKVLSEKVPQVTKIYYDQVRENQVLFKRYLEKKEEYFFNVKHLLKPDPDVFFYVLENYFVHFDFQPLSPAITLYIMNHHKSRFMKKPELYTAWFLNMDALAKCLSSEDVKELVVKLAKAEYLGSWFSYKTVEPLIKRLSEAERAAFKKFVFVDKEFGPLVKEWPYQIPTPPVLIVPQKSLFKDASVEVYNQYTPYNRNEYDLVEMCCGNRSTTPMELPMACCLKRLPVKTLLDELFDKYRFSNYKQTLTELQKRLRAESSAKNRQYILLVLVSKTGGRSEDLATLLDFLSQYKNEPVQIRAAIVRSLVKRAFVWRLTPEYWGKLLEWGHGLGLDGSDSEADCSEGLHAVVARDLIAGVTPPDPVWQAFLEDFSTLTEYSFTAEERGCLRARLPAALLANVQSNPDKAVERLSFLLDTLADYKIRFDDFPDAVEAIAQATKRDFESAKRLLERVYEVGVCRKRLIRENFEIIQTDASYVNALRHDLSILANTTRFEELIGKKELKVEKFLRKLAVYFTEKDGLGERYRAVLQLRATTTPDITLARPLALLAASSFPSLLKDFDAAPPKTPQRQLAAALRSNAHVVRPAFDLDSFGWRAAGAKAVANRVVNCWPKDAERYLEETLSWNRTLRLATVLAKRVGREREAYEVFATKRPNAGFMSALRYFKREAHDSDLRIWDIVKNQISKLHIKQLKRISRYIEYGLSIIEVDRNVNYLAEYCVLVYKACKKNLPNRQKTILYKISLLLHEVDQQFMLEEIEDFLQNYLTDSTLFNTLIKRTNYEKTCFVCLYIDMIAKFLLLSTTEEMLEDKLQKVGIPFFKCLKPMWKQVSKENISFLEFVLDSFLLQLRYNKVYFDAKYVSCLPVFEKLLESMHESLPIEKWFGKYVTVHLTMMYFKTVRLSLEQNPDWSSDEPKKLKEAPKILGNIYGQFVSNEVGELVRKYFPSITELYGAEVVNYFNNYFYRDYDFDESVYKFTSAVVCGLLKSKSIESYIVARFIFLAFRDRLGSENVNYILKSFEKSEINKLCFELDDIM